jgi:hypothetical protein
LYGSSYLGWLHWLDHPVNKLIAHKIAGQTSADGHVLECGRVADEVAILIAGDIRLPFELGGICMAGADVTSLEGLELLGRAQFIGHGEFELVQVVWRLEEVKVVLVLLCDGVEQDAGDEVWRCRLSSGLSL